jgi:HK97 family phage prohead protease
MRDYRNLPDAVTDRLDADLEGKLSATVNSGDRAEARAAFPVELRADVDSGAPVLDGYATVYDTWYDVAGGPDNGVGWREMFASGSTSKSVAERDDVRLLINHEGTPLARTRSGTLRLESDTTGLRAEAVLDPTSPTVQSLVSALDREDVDEMSLAFRAVRQEWNDDYTERIIREAQIFDVSVVTYPANPATVAQIRGDSFTSSGIGNDVTSVVVGGLTSQTSTTTLITTTGDLGSIPTAIPTAVPAEVVEARGMDLELARALRDRLRHRAG